MNPGPPVKGIFTLIANDTRRNAHKLIDHIFHDIFPNLGMAERSEQVALSHKILDALIDGAIALCDAGTGSGKPTHTWQRGQRSCSPAPARANRFSPSSSPPPAWRCKAGDVNSFATNWNLQSSDFSAYIQQVRLSSQQFSFFTGFQMVFGKQPEIFIG